MTELATAVRRPKSTVAHHVKVLTDVGILCVVRTRRVLAIEERFYGFASSSVSMQHKGPDRM